MSTYFIEVTINPVQEFISKVRKTRDLWAGSFMLSYLSASMITAFEEYKASNGIEARIVSPHVDLSNDTLIGLVKESNLEVEGSLFGSLPHFFKIEVENSNETAAIAFAKHIESSFWKAWKNIADGIFKMLPQGLLAEKQNQIWQRQVNSFWSLNWTVSDELGRDKYGKLNRLTLPPSEEWVGCTMFGELADLSGEFRNQDREEFWSKFSQGFQGSVANFDEEEWLSAMGIIKRLFPEWLTNTYNLSALKAELLNYPSTTYFASFPWLTWLERQLDEKEEVKDQLDEYAELVEKYAEHPYETRRESEKPLFFSLASDAFYPDSLKNLDLEDEEVRTELESKLRKIYKKLGETPGTFYAILLMDGDSLGKLFSEAGDPNQISENLGKFAKGVPNTVEKYDGKLIYAGGDDVLAILPLTEVLDCASTIQESYQQIMGTQATISAGIVMAHHKLPLRVALQEAHHQLDEVAKDGNGRSSFAISVLFPSTTKHQWVSTWFDEKNQKVLTRLEWLEKQIDKYKFSNSFFYKAIGILEKLGVEADDPIIPDLLVAEYYSNREINQEEGLKNRPEVEKTCRELVDLCKVRRRDSAAENGYNFGFLRFLKFYRENVRMYE